MWPFAPKRKMTIESWPIVRTKPVKKTYGRSLSIFINNWQCHLTTVDVYEDGSIDCWGFVDRPLFQSKLRSNWVVPAPKPSQVLFVYNFGATHPGEGNWQHTPQDIYQSAEAILQSLNPSMSDLLDMHGSDTEVRGKVRHAKLGLSDKKPYRKDAIRSEDIVGDSVPILRIVGDTYELTRLVVFTDGVCQIGSSPQLIPLDDVQSLYEAKQICNKAPAGSRIVVPNLGSFRNTEDFGSVSVQARIGEIRDKLDVLNGKPSVIRTCIKVFENYTQEPSQQAREALRQAYEAVPEHLRCYCGDMDTKDTAIRTALYKKDVDL
jgi:hypothetical protein